MQEINDNQIQQLNINDKKHSSRIQGFDFLKGLAIIAIFLYHLGGNILPYGYLGVEIFLVISGYLMMKGLIKSFESNKFNYFKYIKQKIVRLTPQVLIVVAITFIIGYFTMLPYTYKQIGENGFASCVYMKNVLAATNANNYWNTNNIFDPFLHFWYVSLLMQAYLFLPLIFFTVYKIFKNNIKSVKYTTILLIIISLILYFVPTLNSGDKFYYLHYRMFEILIGGLIAFYNLKETKDNDLKSKESSKKFIILENLIALTIIGVFVFLNDKNIPNELRLISVVLSTALLVFNYVKLQNYTNIIIKAFAILGKGSYSIYVCHQAIIALVFALYSSEYTPESLSLIICLTIVCSILMYFGVEKQVSKKREIKRDKKVVVAISVSCILAYVALDSCGLAIALNSGVTRDVPELGIVKDDYMWPEQNKKCPKEFFDYVDRPYSWDNDFSKDDKIKVLVIGNSFARDFSNILYESNIKDKIEISYMYPHSESDFINRKERVNKADYIFVAIEIEYYDSPYCLPEYFSKYIDKSKLYMVSDKNFGRNNNQIYINRNKDKYFDSTQSLTQEFMDRHNKLKTYYGDRFVDLIDPIIVDKNRVKVFTDDKKYISWDCRHLTQFGAKYYAKILDLSMIK